MLPMFFWFGFQMIHVSGWGSPFPTLINIHKKRPKFWEKRDILNKYWSFSLGTKVLNTTNKKKLKGSS